MRFNDGRPIFEQIAELLEDRIVAGDPAEGGRLPSARDLASSLEVNPNTAARSLQALADSGAAVMERGSGYFVAPGASEAIRSARRERFFSDELPRLFATMRRLGIDMEEVGKRWKGGLEA